MVQAASNFWKCSPAVEEPDEDAVINATRRMGQLATMMHALEAASELECRALPSR